MMPRWLYPLFALTLLSNVALAQSFQLAPALALEAEDFHIESGWRVIANGHGNYMVDMIGFNHISGERLLCIDGQNETASAFLDVTIPEPGKYRLWVRYEYPAFSEARFRVQVHQDEKTVLDQAMGAKDSLRYGFGNPKPMAQHDRSWGSEGLFEEAVNVPELQAGKARIYLKASPQPQIPGVTAGRHIDFVYLTRDLSDAWMKHYAAHTNLYPILDAFRDSRGPRWEVRFSNKGADKAAFGINHVYNRLPWGATEGLVVKDLPPAKSSAWVPLKMQDTTHFGMTRFTSPGPFEVALRPVGGKIERTLTGTGVIQVYLPPYPSRGDSPVTPEEQIDAILKYLADKPAPGKTPTKPLCYGGWLPLGLDNDYGRKYAQLYAALGFRSLHPAHSGPQWKKNLQAFGVPLTKSWSVTGYRNPPIAKNIEAAANNVKRFGMEPYLLWYDYGDEIAFSEWMEMLIQGEIDRAKEKKLALKPLDVKRQLWMTWLKDNRSSKELSLRPVDYWLHDWGPANANLLRPDSSAAAALANPRLYVDSLQFYEDTAIQFVAEGAQAVRSALGADVLCGANYSCHPFYYPSSTMYITWFRKNAADMGRHSEYFWQVGQAGPMINGYIAEHFRCGMRYNPRAVLRQYVMPHAPGNTDANFLRSCFTHLAHGARMLDFFGIGLNETFTENHIDHRARERFRSIRDVTHAIGLVEDLLPDAVPVPSPVGLLISQSTERWDMAGIARDMAGHDLFGPDFRKVRLNHHLDRLGLWQALTFLGASPDLLIEDDIKPKGLYKNYKVLIVVGDSLPPEMVQELEGWVKDGGVLLATANAGRFDPYRQPNPAWQQFLGLQLRRTEERTTFIRPRLELPFLKPLATIQASDWSMPQLGTYERIGVDKNDKVLATFADDGTPAFVAHSLGRGKIFYVAGQPGLAYLWSALEPPTVPDRGPGTHSIPTAFDRGAARLVQTVLDAGKIKPILTTDPGLIDCRVLRAPAGYLVPLANYNAMVGQKVTLTMRLDRSVTKAQSAYHGSLPIEKKDGVVRVTIPALGYGDLLRLSE